MNVSQPTPKYLVCPGEVAVNGKVRYVTANTLIRWYRVNPKDCLVVHDKLVCGLRIHTKGLTVLAPRGDGNYKLP
jgi:hypothetical protein